MEKFRKAAKKNCNFLVLRPPDVSVMLFQDAASIWIENATNYSFHRYWLLAQKISFTQLHGQCHAHFYPFIIVLHGSCHIHFYLFIIVLHGSCHIHFYLCIIFLLGIVFPQIHHFMGIASILRFGNPEHPQACKSQFHKS